MTEKSITGDINDPNFFIAGKSSFQAEITISDDAWLSLPNLKEVISQILSRLASDEGDLSFSVLLSNDEKLQQLNKDFRNKDNPTNVLSFPSDDKNYLGDIAISYETLINEAKEQDKVFIDHFTHMLIHGILHLEGYDHETTEDASEMETIEIKILQDIGIENPYI